MTRSLVEIASNIELARELVRRELALGDGHRKHYEGATDLEVSLPAADDTDPSAISMAVTLHCYVLGPERHYRFEGTDADLQLLEAVRGWFDEERGAEHE